MLNSVVLAVLAEARAHQIGERIGVTPGQGFQERLGVDSG